MIQNNGDCAINPTSFDVNSNSGNYFYRIVDITKNYIAGFLLIMLFAHTMRLPIIQLDFQLNREFIANNLCENRDNVSSCAGKCYLDKQLDKAEQSDNKESQATLKLQTENLYSVTTFNIRPRTLTLIHQGFTPYQFSASSQHLYEVFHPPQG
jgi:hypothetical protein